MEFLSGLTLFIFKFQKTKMEMSTRKGGQKGDHLGVYLGHYAFILAFSYGTPRNVTRASYFHKRPSKAVLSDTLLALVELFSCK